jgi:Zn-dependent protease
MGLPARVKESAGAHTRYTARSVLRFHLGPFPIHVAPSFLLAAAVLGFPFMNDLTRVALWIVVVFLSVLVHELGHALVGKALGGQPEIRLEGFGGVTFPRLPAPPSAISQIGLSLAGPLAGLLPGVAGWAIERYVGVEPGSAVAIASELAVETSLFWTALNLLPVLPLDGGHVLLAALQGIRKKPSVRAASIISACVAGLAAAAAWLLLGQIFVALWLAMFAFQNLSRVRAVPDPGTTGAPEAVRAAPADERADVDRELSRARAALLARDEETALAVASKLEESEGPFRQAAGLRIRAGVELARGDNVSAGLHAGRSFTLWESADAAVVAARANLRAGERDRALNWLRRAVEAGAHPAAVREDPELGPLA